MMPTALRRLLPAIACFGVAFTLYLLTLSPGVHWGDHAELQLAAAQPTVGIGVRAYPLWSALASAVTRTFSLDPALGANLLSAFFGALSVFLCHAYVRYAFGSLLAAMFSALSLTVCHLLWSSSTVAEVYSLAACFLFLLLITGELSLHRIRRGAFLLGLTAGVSLLHHRMIQLAAVSMLAVLIVLWQQRGTLRRGIAYGLAGMLVGAIPTAALFLFVDHPGGYAERAGFFLLGDLGPHLPTGLGMGSGLLGLLLYGLSFIAFNLAGPQGPAFLLSFRRRRVPWPGHRGILFAFLVGALPVLLLLPHVGDRYVLMLPAICAAIVLSGLVVAERANRGFLRVLLPILALMCPPLIYGTLAATDLSRSAGLFRGMSRVHRQEFLWPGHAGDHSAERFATEVLEALPPDAVLFTEWADGCVLLYVNEVNRIRPEVRIEQTLRQDDFRRAVLANAGRPVFMTTYPHTPNRLRPPPGFVLQELIPGTLWAVLTEGDR